MYYSDNIFIVIIKINFECLYIKKYDCLQNNFLNNSFSIPETKQGGIQYLYNNYYVQIVTNNIIIVNYN